ncbi:hypothetical protein [Cardinium endosymbiont of Bemisia tabaci]|nr:hypothetical protein [Cardinium endosymbiont of Bemisia tabaci]
MPLFGKTTLDVSVALYSPAYTLDLLVENLHPFPYSAQYHLLSKAVIFE